MSKKGPKSIKVQGHNFKVGSGGLLAINVKASLEFAKEAKKITIVAITLLAQNDNDEGILSDVMDGKIKGLEYCEEKKIKAVAGGGNVYVLRVYE